MEEGTNAVVLDARSEPGLAVVARKLAIAGIPHVVIHEPDEPYCGAMTAIGVVPLKDRSAIKKIVSSLPLLREAGRKPVEKSEEAKLAVI
jgi:hypothetical protein